MPLQSFLVNATKIEFVCVCRKGVYRLAQKTPDYDSKIHQWQHNSTHCKREAFFTVPYPLIESKSKEVTRTFIMRDSVPPPGL